MEQIGYSLIDDTGKEIAFWGDTPGQCAGVPEVLRTPTGDFVHCAKVGERYGAFRLVTRWFAWGTSETIKTDDTRGVVVTRLVDPNRIIAERSRRLAEGFTYDFGDERGAHRIGTTEEDLRGWDEVSKVAQASVLLGQPDMPLNIVTDTGAVSLSAQEWQKVLVAAARFRQPIWIKSFELLKTSPIPPDFTSDKHWS